MAGGQSRRMGRDKAAVEIDGVSLLEHACIAGVKAGMPVVVIGRSTEALPRHLRERFPEILGVEDLAAGLGPVGGLLTALRCRQAPGKVMMTACDVPALSPESLTWLAEAADRLILTEDCAGLIPLKNGAPEPLFAVYTSAALPVAEELLSISMSQSKSAPSLRSLIAAAPFVFIPLPAIHYAAVDDIDTPEELARHIQI